MIKEIINFKKIIEGQNKSEFLICDKGFLWYDDQEKAVVTKIEPTKKSHLYLVKELKEANLKEMQQIKMGIEGEITISENDKKTFIFHPLTPNQMKEKQVRFNETTFLNMFDYLEEKKEKIVFEINKNELKEEIKKIKKVIEKYNQDEKKIIMKVDMDKQTIQFMLKEWDETKPLGPEKMLLDKVTSFDETFFIYFSTLYPLIIEEETNENYLFEVNEKGYVKIHYNHNLSCVLAKVKM